MAAILSLDGTVKIWEPVTYDTDVAYDCLRIDEDGKVVEIMMIDATSSVTLSLDKGDYSYAFKEIVSAGTTVTAGKAYGGRKGNGKA